MFFFNIETLIYWIDMGYKVLIILKKLKNLILINRIFMLKN